MRALLDRLLGHDAEADGPAEAGASEAQEEMFVKHRLTLRAAQAKLSAADRELLEAIDETGAAIERSRRRRARH